MTLRFQLQIQQCPYPPHFQTQQQQHLRIRCTLTKHGQRFLRKLSISPNTNTDNLIRKFVQSSSKAVLLSTLTHLLSPTTTTTHHHRNNLSSLALPLYTRMSESQWFTWNPIIVADLISLLHKLQLYAESQTLISQATSKLINRKRDLVFFYCKLLESHSKRASQTGFHQAYSYLENIIHTSSSFYVKRRASEYMVSGLCTMDRPRDAENLLREFQQTVGIQPSGFEFKSILYGYGRLGMFQDLVRVVDEMERNGFAIDTVCYNMVLSTYGIHGEHVEMVAWLRRMRSSGVPFAIRTYNSVSNSCMTIMRKVVEMNDLPFSMEELLNECLEGGEGMVIKELLSSYAIFEEVMVWDSSEAKLDLHGFHLSSAYLVMLLWFEEMRKRLLNGSNYEFPAEVTVVCGVGKHSKFRGESPVKALVKKMMVKMEGPLRLDRKNNGCFVAKGKAVKIWLCELGKP